MQSGLFPQTTVFHKGRIVNKIKTLQITQRQRELMTHAINSSGRNFYGACHGDPDTEDWDLLVAAGYATRRDAPDWMIDDIVYHVTEAGRKASGESYEQGNTTV